MGLLRNIFLACCIVCACFLSASGQRDTTRMIKVHFLYGSKPHRAHKDKETKWFGGLHGGHVSIEVDDKVIGFAPSGKLHIFAKRKPEKFHSGFQLQELESFRQDSIACKYATVHIPVTQDQYMKITDIHSAYYRKAPYDYAFFGMRCAAATYEILGQLDIVKRKSRLGNIVTHFYPKPLRKKMFRIARSRSYLVTSQPGRPTRKWEKD
jgi:hypothetical protein